MEAFLKDLRQSVRMFAQSPAFTLAAIAALTLGIGANTAIFSVVNAVLLKPVAFPEPDRIVLFMNQSPQGSGPAASPAKFQHYRQQSAVAQDVAAFSGGIVNYTGGSIPEQLEKFGGDPSQPQLLGEAPASQIHDARVECRDILHDAALLPVVHELGG